MGRKKRRTSSFSSNEEFSLSWSWWKGGGALHQEPLPLEKIRCQSVSDVAEVNTCSKGTQHVYM